MKNWTGHKRAFPTRRELYACVHLGIGVAHHGNEKVEKEEEDDHDKEAPVDLAFKFKI